MKVIVDILISLVIVTIGFWAWWKLAFIISKFVNEFQSGMPSGVFW